MERLPNGRMEFSWKKALINGKNILPEVRSQGQRYSGFINAVVSGVEMDILRQLVEEDPPATTDLRLRELLLEKAFEVHIGCTLKENSNERVMQRGAPSQTEEFLSFFQSEGVLARSAHSNHETTVKLKDYEVVRKPSFENVCDFIFSGKPIVGGMSVGKEFYHLKPDEIYEFNRDPNMYRPVFFKHMVLFVGFGFDGTDQYLVFMNSHGKKFGEKGFGRIYFDQVDEDFFVLSADPPHST